jgi:predicted dehydrogenase
MTDRKAEIAVIGAGWWTQGWHLPALSKNPFAKITAIVDTSTHPKSNLNPDLEPLSALQTKYNTRIFSSVDELLADEIGPKLDGCIIATPHSTHYNVGRQIMKEIDRRKEVNGDDSKPLHILMEKPLSTHIEHALNIYKLVKDKKGPSQFWINHSANFREQTKLARQTIESGKIGAVRHITAFFASPLASIFEDPANKGWNEPTEGMLGNGFAWGQSSHLFAWLFHVCPDLQPVDVFCSMVHSTKTGADISHSATIRCTTGRDDEEEPKEYEYAVISVSGTSMLPGDAHSDPPVGKRAQIKIFGSEGALLYEGDDRNPKSGQLELRHPSGKVEVLHPNFVFENLDHDGMGPESLQNFVQLCCGNKSDELYVGANVTDGLRSIQVIDAMYRSHHSQQQEKVCLPKDN